MKRNFQAGEGMLEGIVVLAALIFVIVLLPRAGSPLGIIDQNTPSSRAQNSRTSSVLLGSGNAAYAYQPYEEYITIENRSGDRIDITGWQLRNGKDRRQYDQGSALQRFSADIALLPSVVLEPGDRAIVTTGRVSVETPHKIGNFKENKCTGYIEALPDYAFTPPLSQSCPNPALEPGLENLDKECRDFVSSLQRCQTPRMGGRDAEGDLCRNCVNGRRVTSACAAFIEERFSYQGCVASHASDANYSGRTWRIFLGRGWEMWAEDYETIELYNSLGQLMDFKNY